MSATGLDVFDKTLQSTNIWLNEIMDVIGPDRQVAWHVLGAVLRAVRDRVPLELAGHLGSQLPILVRGVYYDQWRPAAKPAKYRSLDEFVACIDEGLASTRPVNRMDAIRAVFGVLSRHIPEGQIVKVRDALPEEVRALWVVAPEQVGPAEPLIPREERSPERRARRARTATGGARPAGGGRSATKRRRA
jgi:uncharacterized protein (DUF2267 family)